MPTIRVTSVEGHTDAQVRSFMEKVTQLAVDELGAKREGVIVHFEMLPADRYMRGGSTIAELRRRG